MIFNELNDKNWLIFAIKNYENPSSATEEDFYEDLKRFKYIKRLLKKYKRTGTLKSHLLINHFIILYNVFGEATTPLLFFKMDRELWSCLKTFLYFLNRIPEYPKSILNDIEIDENCLQELKSL